MESCSKFFFLVGFPALQDFQTSFHCVLVILHDDPGWYAIIITMVVVDRTFHTSMYFFLINLSMLDILFTTTTMPRMPVVFLTNANTMLFRGCFLQTYSFHGLIVTKVLLLVVMAYNHYEAICNPLRYPANMTRRANIQLAVSTCITALLIPLPVITQTSQLASRYKARVCHCFCDNLSVVQTVCSVFSAKFKTLGFSIVMTVSVLPLLLITLSYIHIIPSVLKISPKEGHMKAFPTCNFHLLVVGNYNSSITVASMSYRVDIPIDVHITSNVTFAILTCLLNPIIYTLGNKEVKSVVIKLFG